MNKERSITNALTRTDLIAFQPSWNDWVLLESNTRYGLTNLCSCTMLLTPSLKNSLSLVSGWSFICI